MVTLRARVDTPALEPEAFVAAVPLLVQRARALRFDDDGVARFPTGRRCGLRLTDGVAGRPGARYHVVLAADDQRDPTEFDCEVVADDARVTEVVIGYPEGRVRLALDQPTRPERVRVQADLETPDLPGLLGRHLAGTLTVRLADPWALPGPQLAGHAELRAARAAITAEVRPQPGERWQTTLDLTGHPRGVGVLAWLVWPFVRQRVRRALVAGVQQSLTDLARRAADLGPAATDPTQIADRAWCALPEMLAR